MLPVRIENPFRKMKFPVRMDQNYKTKIWYIFDKEDDIVADNMTKCNAETTRDTLNYIGNTLAYLLDVFQIESEIAHNPTDPRKVIARDNLLDEIFDFLTTIGIVQKPKPDYRKAILDWARDLTPQQKEPEWTRLYHTMKESGELK